MANMLALIPYLVGTHSVVICKFIKILMYIVLDSLFGRGKLIFVVELWICITYIFLTRNPSGTFACYIFEVSECFRDLSRAKIVSQKSLDNNMKSNSYIFEIDLKLK